MDFNSFERSIKRSKPSPIYVVSGDEAFLVKQALVLIKDKVLNKEFIDLSLIEYCGDEVAFGMIVDELWTVTLLGNENKRLIIVESADELFKKYDKKMKKYFAKPSLNACLVLVCNNLSAWVKKLDDNNLITVECKKIKDYYVESWLVKRSKVHGKRLTTEAAKLLVGETGNDLGLLENHLIKLSTYIGERNEVTIDDVNDTIFNGRKHTVFVLTDAMADKNTATALQILDNIITQGGDAVSIISVLTWQLRRIWTAKRIINECKKSGLSSSKRLQSELKINPYFLDKFVNQVMKFTERDLIVKYRRLAEADIEVKTSGLDLKLILECLLIKLCK